MKMKIFSASIILSLLCISLFILSSCANDNNLNDQDTVDNEVEINVTAEYQSSIPEGTDFGGMEIRILNCSYYTEDSVWMNASEEIGEVVNDALYDRNLKVQNDLNINFKFTDISLVGGDNFNQTVRNSVMSGSDDYDILIDAQYDIAPLATAGIFMNLVDAPYINLSQPWWPEFYIREMTIGKDILYFLTSDMSLTFIRNMSCAYFNKDLYSEYFGDPDDMYKTVLDGKWTLDKLSEMGKAMYIDVNGNGEFDNDDQYGYAVITSNLTEHLMYDAGIRVTDRDENGIPYFIFNTEKTATFIEKLYGLLYENEGGRLFPPTNESNNIDIPRKFMNNELLFDFGWFYTSELLRDMPSDYGIIPYPKYDESQSTYLSLAHDIVPIYSVPITCKSEKLPAVGAVFEAMAYETYVSVMPAYYEVALKFKYTRDSSDDVFKIIDIIHDNCTTDFAYIYNYALSSMGQITRSLMAAKSFDFVSKYESMISSVQEGLDKLIDEYLKNEN